MAKKLIPQKIVIEFIDGKFSNGVIIYKVNDNGALTRTRSIGLKNADFSKSALNGLLEKFVKHAKKSEVIPDDVS